MSFFDFVIADIIKAFEFPKINPEIDTEVSSKICFNHNALRCPFPTTKKLL